MTYIKVKFNSINTCDYGLYIDNGVTKTCYPSTVHNYTQIRIRYKSSKKWFKNEYKLRNFAMEEFGKIIKRYDNEVEFLKDNFMDLLEECTPE